MSYVNFVRVKVVTPVTNVATSFAIEAAVAPQNLPPTDGGYLVLCDSPGNPSWIEVVQYTSRSGLGISGVTRGVEGTTAVAWSGNVYAFQALMAGEANLIQTTLAGKQAEIAAGTTSQFWRGDKTWVDFMTTVRAATLTGLSLATGTAITAADTVLSGLGKLQKQITDAASALAANVRAVVLTGYVAGSNTALAATDSVLSAFGKVQGQLNAKANAADAALTGVPTAPTAAGGTNTLQVSNTAFVQQEIATLIASAPGALDTLNELAAAMGDDPNFAATMTTALAGKEPTITSDLVSKFYSGTKTWRDLSTDVRAVVLTGLSFAVGTSISSGDSILVALGKLQKQITDLGTNKLDASANAVSATKLVTARTINGVSFDGTANITIADGTKEPTIAAGTTAQYWRGDKTWQTLNKTAVGLANVDNTTDANKPVSTAQQTALDLKVNTSAIVDNLNSSSATVPLSANQGKVLGDTINALSGRNRIINGACLVTQRPSDAFATGNTGYAGPDRFRAVNGASAGGQFTQSVDAITYLGVAQAAVKQTVNTAIASRSTGNYWMGIHQLIEGFNCYDMEEEGMALSFTFNTNVSGTYSVAIRDGAPTNSFVTTFVAVANTPMKVEILLPAEPLTIARSSAAGLSVIIGALNTGTYQTATLGSWQTGNFFTASGATNWGATAGNFIAVTELQLEKGIVCTPFERKPLSEEVANCQRYYYRLLAGVPIAMGHFRASTTACGYMMKHPVQMRAGPSASFSAGAAVNIYCSSGAPLSGSNGVTVSAQDSIWFTSNSSLAAAMDSPAMIVVASGQYIEVSAEL